MAKSNAKPDKSLFQGFDNTQTSIQKVVPVNEASGEALAGVNFQVPKSFKKTVDIYIATKEMSLKDFFIQAAQEYMEHHKDQ